MVRGGLPPRLLAQNNSHHERLLIRQRRGDCGQCGEAGAAVFRRKVLRNVVARIDS
jgi:hypothetical protein